MCLTINGPLEKHIAEEPIIVYKHAILTNDGTNDSLGAVNIPRKEIKRILKDTANLTLLTPYINAVIHMQKFYTTELIATFITPGDASVGQGLHAFKSFESAVYDMEDEAKHNGCECVRVIMECVIPKGAAYYTGRFAFLSDAIAANTMMYIGVVAYKQTILSETSYLEKKRLRKPEKVLKDLIKKGLL
jgi:hypothetical protein